MKKQIIYERSEWEKGSENSFILSREMSVIWQVYRSKQMLMFYQSVSSLMSHLSADLKPRVFQAS